MVKRKSCGPSKPESQVRILVGVPNQLALDVAKGIAVEMERQGVIRAELARRLGKSRPYVTQALSGQRNLTLASVSELAGALDCVVLARLVPRDG